MTAVYSKRRRVYKRPNQQIDRLERLYQSLIAEVEDDDLSEDFEEDDDVEELEDDDFEEDVELDDDDDDEFDDGF